MRKNVARHFVGFKTPPFRVTFFASYDFKDSGEPVTIKAEVEKVIQLADLTPQKLKKFLINTAKPMD